jgi:hypothetical protein
VAKTKQYNITTIYDKYAGHTVYQYNPHPALNSHGLPFRSKQEFPYSYDEFKTFDSRKDIETMKNISTIWSDHLYRFAQERGYDYNAACRQVWGNEGQYFDRRSPSSIEKFLRIYFGKDDIKLLQVFEGCNPSDGYPYWKFIVQVDWTKEHNYEVL